jgi:hypothetical protein
LIIITFHKKLQLFFPPILQIHQEHSSTKFNKTLPILHHFVNFFLLRALWTWIFICLDKFIANNTKSVTVREELIHGELNFLPLEATLDQAKHSSHLPELRASSVLPATPCNIEIPHCLRIKVPNRTSWFL